MLKMDQKKLLEDNEEIKLIVEKNQEIIEAMKKLNQLLDNDSISKSTGGKKSNIKNIEGTNGEVEG
jgi:hypothetical protein